MNKQFVPYKQALALKELGFNEPCLGYWNIDPYLPKPTFNIGKVFDHEWCLPAPLYQQAFRWFRDKYLLDSIIQPTYSTKYQYRVIKTKVQVYGDYMGKEFSSFEEAELECLKKLIELVKSK
jgi:hypothetical protein